VTAPKSRARKKKTTDTADVVDDDAGQSVAEA
jgi:hypothetical protein